MVIQNVLVALDFSEVSDPALGYAREFARQFDARLHVLHVMDNDFLQPRPSICTSSMRRFRGS